MNTQPDSHSLSRPDLSRRQFLKGSSLAAAGAAAFPYVHTTHAAPDDPIRIGLIGCGGRGTGAVLDALGAATKVIYPSAGYHTEDVDASAKLETKNIQVVALADMFQDRINSARENFSKLGINIPDERCFTGFDAYKKLLAIGEINYVILATPPHFRPAQVLAAVEAGKNVFMEKPVAVDGQGVKIVMKAGELAKQKGLSIGAGIQRRYQRGYRETIKRLRDGEIGEILSARCYWNGGVIWVIERKEGWTDMEWQLRNWNYFTWLGGDHIVEQHVHNLDIMNWALGAHPVKAYGMGGRQARPNKNYGHIYDHFAIEYEYPNGVIMTSQCRQMNSCEGRVEERVVGTKGTSNCVNWIKQTGGQFWRFREQEVNAYQQEHKELVAAIRTGKPINDAFAIAEATLVGIMGREAAYSGQTIEWEQALNMKTRLGPEKYELGALPFPDVATPGFYKFA